MSSVNDNIEFTVVTMHFEVLDDNSEELLDHLDYQLKSDNWTLISDKTPLYIKNNYLFSMPNDFDDVIQEFNQDLQAIFSVSVTKLLSNCSCEQPFTGIAHIGNLGHVSFSINHSKDSNKFEISCIKFHEYGHNINLAEDLIGDIFD